MALFKTEVTSETIPSDNPIHQRLLKPYVFVADIVRGTTVEIGCGDGRGIDMLAPKTKKYIALDKNVEAIKERAKAHKNVKVVEEHIPPIQEIADNTADVIISFQVIEHIKDDKKYLEEIYRVLRPGGRAYITTPNIKMTLTRNPWHIREYTADQLRKLAKSIYEEVEMKGIAGNDKVMAYYEQNKRSVEKITRFDVFNLQNKLPAGLLKIPYELLNRMNRNKLKESNDELVRSISHEDYLISDKPDTSLDLFLIATKK